LAQTINLLALISKPQQIILIISMPGGILF